MSLTGQLFARTDPNTRQILESMRTGAINIKQAAEALGMEPAMLAYQLAGKVGNVVFHFFSFNLSKSIFSFSILIFKFNFSIFLFPR